MSDTPDSRHPAHAAAEGMRYMVGICGGITKEHGFDVSQYATQVLLIATEVDEALEHVGPSGNKNIGAFRADLRIRTRDFEDYRNGTKVDHSDNSRITNQQEFLEELSDICIRVFSFVGGNDFTDEFLATFAAKVKKNADRPHKHGKKMALFEHVSYNPKIKELATANEDMVVGKGRPNELQVGKTVGDKEIVEIYTIAIVGSPAQEKLKV
jgi:hypothetical protein